jgi:hypothetical protein
MKIGGWRTRSVFERYAIVNRNDMADAILKLEQKEKQFENGHDMVSRWPAQHLPAPLPMALRALT